MAESMVLAREILWIKTVHTVCLIKYNRPHFNTILTSTCENQSDVCLFHTDLQDHTNDRSWQHFLCCVCCYQRHTLSCNTNKKDLQITWCIARLIFFMVVKS
jgi:hypothetical protein